MSLPVEIERKLISIALINTITKIVTQIIISESIQNWTDSYSIIPEHQNDYRNGRGCTDNLYILSNIIGLQLRLPKKMLFTVFVNF